MTTDATGKVVSTQGHFPAGEAEYQTGATSDFEFTTYRRDANSGLDYADARFYSPPLGRFMSPDPLLGGGYAYASSDPINLVDPTGLDAGMPCSLDPFHNFALPLCGPDQIGNGVGFGGDCGVTFGDNLSFDFSFSSNCKSFTINFNDSTASGPFGSYQDTLLNILREILPIDTCPPGTFECPENGRPLFGQPTCDPRWCVFDGPGNSFVSPTDDIKDELMNKILHKILEHYGVDAVYDACVVELNACGEEVKANLDKFDEGVRQCRENGGDEATCGCQSFSSSSCRLQAAKLTSACGERFRKCLWEAVKAAYKKGKQNVDDANTHP